MQDKRSYTHAEYFEIEAQADFRCEYHNGEIVFLTGGGLNHSLIGVNAGTALHNSIKVIGKDCLVLVGMKIYLEKADAFLYPDLMVVCGEAKTHKIEEQGLTNPLLIIEVLSDSTERFDRGDKFRKYCTLPSFQEYVLIDQHRPIVEVLTKNKDFTWTLQRISGTEASFYLKSIDCTLKMEDIYYKARNLKSAFSFDV